MIPFPHHSLFFAPLEGITDGAYRQVIQTLAPEWDFMACDFLRIPSVGKYPKNFLIEHFGETNFHSPVHREKTFYQVLASERSIIDATISDLIELGLSWIDLNLGCPSKTVNSNGGGAYLLSDTEKLTRIVREIRQQFKGTFTCKMRLGFRDTLNFERTLKILEAEGVEAITIHARTRDQLYTGTADWSYIKRAVQLVKIPIIGNGDIWDVGDIEKIFNETNCHSVMVARGAMKTPWMASLYKQYGNTLSHHEKLSIRKIKLQLYFPLIEQVFRQELLSPDEVILKRFKSLSRYLFDDFPEGEVRRSRFLRAPTLENFYQQLRELPA